MPSASCSKNSSVLNPPAPTAKPAAPDVVIVGSVALDTIVTPWERRADVPGGSATYACIAASRRARTGIVGVVGEDFPRPAWNLFRRAGVDLSGLQCGPGRTFRWTGEYFADMNQRRTLQTELNVFEDFRPELPLAYQRAPLLFLANIAPELQLHVLDQMAQRPRWVVADTMDLWIRTARPALEKVIRRVDVLTVNESEVRDLTGCASVPEAARKVLRMGPTYVLVKRGEYGSWVVGRDVWRVVPAFPVERVRDPTGAGDTFAGGLMGELARSRGNGAAALVRAAWFGTVLASVAVEDFGPARLLRVPERELKRRLSALRESVRYG